MGDVFGADFLMNPKIVNAGDVSMANIESVELPTIDIGATDDIPAPKLVPSLNETGPLKTDEGLNNFNAEPFFGASSTSHRKMSEEHIMKEKYELLRKFERLGRLGVPMRKRFTLDSPIEEMRMELDFIKREKDMDDTIQQFAEWYVSGMSALEWSSTNVAFMKAFGLKLQGLSEAAQMNVSKMEDDFEELYDMYGDKLKLHPLIKIPIRTCMMVYMVHLTNQMALKSDIPNIDQVLKSNPDIARQLATAAMQQQSQSTRAAPPPMPPPQMNSNPLSGLSSFMSSMVPPAPPNVTASKPMTSVKPAIKYPKPNPQPPIASAPPPANAGAPAPVREMKGPSVNIDDLLKSVNSGVEVKKVTTSASSVTKKGGSTGKNSVSIKL